MPEEDILLVGGDPGFLLLLAVVVGNAFRRQFQRGAGFGGDRRQRPVDLFGLDFHRRGAQFQPVEAGGIVEDRLIAAGADIGDDRLNRLDHADRRRLPPFLDLAECVSKAGIGEMKNLDHATSLNGR